MIRYERFTKRFGRVVAARDVELSVRRGEALALIGPNGSGKTTTLKAALGLVRPTAGRVQVAGMDVARDGARVRRRLGYLPQRLTFPDACTAREVMRLYARVRGADPREVERHLERVGLAAHADRGTEGFSGGMLQRLGLAIALLGEPEALILDEPTAALDPTGALAIRDLVAEIHRDGTTILFSSHDLAEVSSLADRVAVFVDGRVAAVGEPGELARELALPSRLRVGIRGGDGAAAAAAERAGARRVCWHGESLHCEVTPGGEAAVIDAVRGAGIGVTDLSVRSPGLEEVYRAVTDPARRVA